MQKIPAKHHQTPITPKINFALFTSFKDMSRAAKITLACTSTSAVGIVILVHYQQKAEKAVSLLPQQWTL